MDRRFLTVLGVSLVFALVVSSIFYQMTSRANGSPKKQEVGDLLQAGDEAGKVARLVGTAVVLREHRPEVEAPRRRARGAEASDVDLVERWKARVAVDVGNAAGSHPIEGVGRGLGRERQADDGARRVRLDDGEGNGWHTARVEEDLCGVLDDDRLVEAEPEGAWSRRDRREEPRRGAVLRDERVRLVEHASAVVRLRRDPHNDLRRVPPHLLTVMVQGVQ